MAQATHDPEQNSRPPKATPNLVWAIVEGEPREVSEFGHHRPRDRPSASCPQCSRAVTMKLGQVVAHHFAHRPGDDCAASSGETALHLNAKFHLARELRQIRGLEVQEYCADEVRDTRPRHSGYLPCPETRSRRWEIPEWTEVQVELMVGTRRPDITLLAEGVPVAAVEVVVTHRVDDEKAEDLEALGVPWLEVAAREVLGDSTPSWSCASPLPVLRFSRESMWICPSHVARREAQAARLAQAEKDAKEAQAKREYERKNRIQAWYFRVVDLYWPSGKKFREIYEMMVEIADGKVTAVWLECRSRDREIATAKRLDRDGSRQDLVAAFDREIERLKRQGATVDSPMRWMASNRAAIESDLVAYSDFYFPRRYKWSERNARWFPVREHRDTRWDRPIEEQEDEGSDDPDL